MQEVKSKKQDRKSQPFPLGSTFYPQEGVNFSLFSPYATQVELLLFSAENDTNPEIMVLNEKEHKTYYYWHIFIPNLPENQIYAYRISGENLPKHQFDNSKILIDPYGKAIVGKNNRTLASQPHQSNLSECLKSVVIHALKFDWKNTQKPTFPNAENIIYEMHLPGFTAQTKTKYAGTFLGIIEQIPYLKELGINTIELLPIFFFDEEDAPKNRKNYWGYSPINYFSLHRNYGFSKNPAKIIQEFKQMVQALHQNDLKIVLDVVYNHSAENDASGPHYSFKGICNSSYYILDENHQYHNFSGCGNTLNTNHSVVRRMILDSLLYWKKEFHIDGFRFDLASIFARDEDGNVAQKPPIIWEIDSEPELAETLLIAEPWDAKGLHQTQNFAGDKWCIWKDSFRDICRKIIKGDNDCVEDFVAQFTGSYSQKKGNHLSYSPHRNINFITAHDGFTLKDLVSYNEKHNLENGENNRDGSSHNLSYNHGFEGETEDASLKAFRTQQMKNFLFCLLFSHGIPMLLMGDECQRTQNGNNNGYCVSEEHTLGLDWNLKDENQSFFNYVKELIQLRKQFSVFSCEDFFATEISETKPYFLLHGTALNQPDFSYHSRSIAVEYVFHAKKEHLFLLFNFYSEELIFQLPKGNWTILTATNSETGMYNESFTAKARTLYLLKSEG